MLELAFKVIGYWLAASFIVLPFVLALLKANGPDPRSAPKPVLVWVNERKAEER